MFPVKIRKKTYLILLLIYHVNIFESDVLKIFETMDGLVSRSGKMLSTFEFWLECKGKTFLGIVNKLFYFQFNIKLIQSKTFSFSVFSVDLLNSLAIVAQFGRAPTI